RPTVAGGTGPRPAGPARTGDQEAAAAGRAGWASGPAVRSARPSPKGRRWTGEACCSSLRLFRSGSSTTVKVHIRECPGHTIGRARFDDRIIDDPVLTWTRPEA